MGIVPDGNRRWARLNGVPVEEGYRRGAARTVEVLRWCEQAGVQTVTVWALSLDNAAKRQELPVMLDAISALTQALTAEDGWRLNVLGSPKHLEELGLPALSARTRHRGEVADATGGLRVNLAVAYDGRDEILAAVRALLAHGGDQALKSLDREAVSGQLARWGQPDCDLIVRASGEQRLSGFLLWQSAVAELYFSPQLWPDFDRASFDAALASYATRERRFGA